MAEYELIRSKRKTLSIQIKNDGTLLVRAPMRLPLRQIEDFLREKSDWIESNRRKVLQAKRAGEQSPLSEADIRKLVQYAKRVVPPIVQQYAETMGVTYGRISIRSQKGKWGSCSSAGNLNFNCLLMLTPPEILDYVIVHELAHRKQMNHSADFWAEVEAVLPDYRERLQWLKRNGPVLLARMRSGEAE